MNLSVLPNAICVMRMLLIVPILWTLEAGAYELALALFAIAGFSDGLDGFLAKRFGWRSELGGLLDPLADKLLLVSVFLAVTLLGLVPAWLTSFVIGRDVLIVFGAIAYQYFVGPVHGRPTAVSKLNTILQLLFILVTVAHAAYAWPADSLVTVLGAGVFVTTVVSGIDYVWTWGLRARRTLRGSTA
ncbi:MAG: CDP-alcohol phosphatidyltransferase family protein [Gammaproteobacteria bacterium]